MLQDELIGSLLAWSLGKPPEERLRDVFEDLEDRLLHDDDWDHRPDEPSAPARDVLGIPADCHAHLPAMPDALKAARSVIPCAVHHSRALIGVLRPLYPLLPGTWE